MHAVFDLSVLIFRVNRACSPDQVFHLEYLGII